MGSKSSIDLQKKQLEKAKSKALVGVPKVIRDLYLKVDKPKDKRSSNEILMEVRYGLGCA